MCVCGCCSMQHSSQKKNLVFVHIFTKEFEYIAVVGFENQQKTLHITMHIVSDDVDLGAHRRRKHKKINY